MSNQNHHIGFNLILGHISGYISRGVESHQANYVKAASSLGKLKKPIYEKQEN